MAPAATSTPATPPALLKLPPLAEILEVCAALKVSRRTVYNWMDKGKVEWVTLPSGLRRIVTASLLKVGTNNGR